MDKKAVFFIFVIVAAVLNTAAIRRAEDPVRDTQTDPILYKQKMEEEKDGKKGPLMYNVRYNPSDNFLTAPPFERKADRESLQGSSPADSAATGELNWWDEPVSPSGEGDWGSEASGNETSDAYPPDVREESRFKVAATPAANDEDYWW
ncbi:MAG: hypothetical protein BWY42_00982 [Candidatus Omnitrophica bacterium ADurb.Bin277]|nr:MAG: hypothetical protein BWY42_00982 [Candidatus Omnitrophica bacterium ADurb.Bin277]